MGAETEEDNQPRYTTARLRREVAEAKRLARIHALEEAALAAEAEEDGLYGRAGELAASRIAIAIRALMKKEGA